MHHGRWQLLPLFLLGFIISASQNASAYDAVPGEFVVKMRSDVATTLHSLSSSLGGEVVRKVSNESNTYLIRRPVVESTDYAIQTLTEHPLIERVTPNYIYYAHMRPNDPKLKDLWGLINEGQKIDKVTGTPGIDIGAEAAWEFTTGNRRVVVAVIDTGVDYNHADLKPNMWTNQAELNGQPGVDDDGNGYVDDIYGYDFANNDGDPLDDNGHGSHVAGTIGAKGNNGFGVAGVSWNVSIMAVKFLKGNGYGDLASAIAAIEYAVKMKAQILNNSWGGGPFNQDLYDAISSADKAGALFVASAGNSGENNDTNPSYPASYQIGNVISVAAIDNRGELADFSNYGEKAVHVAAPGVDILSTYKNGFASMSGTSMASPHVSGLAALLLAREPNLSLSQLKERILKGARLTAGLRGYVSHGLINAYYSLTDTAAPPDPNDPATWTNSTYELSSEHPYRRSARQTWRISQPGAQRMALYFSRFETEAGYDTLTFKSADGTVIAVWSGKKDRRYSPIIPGDTVIISLSTDETAHKYGFDITGIAYQ